MKTTRKFSRLQVASFYAFLGSASLTFITILALLYKGASILFGFTA